MVNSKPQVHLAEQQGSRPVGKVWQLAPYILLLVILAFSLSTKLASIQTGAPHVTIDDQTMYEAGFLVWFGQAPPQRMYLESWISGLTSITTYVAMNLGREGLLGINLVADAYRDFFQNPDPYVISYRSLMLCVDLLTALLVFFLGRELFWNKPARDWIAVLASGFYLLSFNTLWAYIVARPDTVTAFFSVLGLLLYYRSGFGSNRRTLILSGVALGTATGMKLHAALFVVFICLDMWRLFGFKEALRRVFSFGCVSVISFAVVAGSVLFDPLLYIKLRLLNARDDASPWLQWGDQFPTLLQGTGWLVVPLLLATVWFVRRSGQWSANQKLSSLLFISLCWLVLFASLRVLRAYWMLPALPLFYLAAAYGLSQIRWRYARMGGAGLLVAVMGLQLWGQMAAFRDTRFNELRDWVQAHIEPNEPVYVLGYLTLNLPLNTPAISVQSDAIAAGLRRAVAAEEPFTQRHIRLWEERARLRLFDMLNYRSQVGWQYYGYFGFPPALMEKIHPVGGLPYILVQEGFVMDQEPEIAALLKSRFEPVAELTGPGGGGRGLSYSVYRQK